MYDRNYNLVHLNTGLRHRAIDSVVQDVDRDDGGLNELLVLTQGGGFTVLILLGSLQILEIVARFNFTVKAEMVLLSIFLLNGLTLM